MKTDKRVVQTKFFILEALLILMEKFDYEDISISDIAVKAGVARQTIYRYYKNKDAILIDGLDRIHEEMITQISAPVKTREEAIDVFFDYIIEHKRFLQMFHKAQLDLLIMEKFKQYMEEYYESSSNFKTDKITSVRLLISRYTAGAIYMVYTSFITNEVQLSSQEYAVLFHNLHCKAKEIMQFEVE